MYQSILLPVDIDEKALTEKALAQAKYLVEESQASLRILYVMSKVPDYILSRLNPQTSQFDDVLATEVEGELEKLAAGFDIPADRISTRIRQGSVYDEILQEAEEIQADLIVIGSRRPSVTTYLLGSNAAAIVRHAKTAVLVVR